MVQAKEKYLSKFIEKYPKKFVDETEIFKHIKCGNRIFVGTGCGHPQYLVLKLIDYINHHPKAIFDSELLQVWTLGVAPFLQERFKINFRLNSFFIGSGVLDVINQGLADYTPIALSQVPKLFRRKLIPIDVALIQTSLPDAHGNLSLGISVDIVKEAVEQATLVIAQINPKMPHTFGESLIQLKDIDYCLWHSEELLEFSYKKSDATAKKIGKLAAKLIKDGDTLQVGYGSLCNEILESLSQKKHLGIHTELLNDGICQLIKAGVIDNSKKSVDKGKSVAAFCMGTKPTFEFIHNNPKVEFHPVDYTNNPLIIAKQKNMTAINSALQIDLTGQSTAESLGNQFVGGLGGQTDFMRSAILAHEGKTILTIRSTASKGRISRIVPALSSGAGVTLNRGDVHYVITEYGIAFLHGKNVRERAMSLIAIAHPKFREWLIEEAKKLNLIYKDQTFISGPQGEYPEYLETMRTTKRGLTLKLRPVKMNDEALLKKFFYSLSNASVYRRFISARRQFSHELLQEFVIIDYSKEIVMLAILEEKDKETVVGLGEYHSNPDSFTAEFAFAVLDDFQNKGIGTEILSYLIFIAQKQGLLEFTAQVLPNNLSSIHVIENMGYVVEKDFKAGNLNYRISFVKDDYEELDLI